LTGGAQGPTLLTAAVVEGRYDPAGLIRFAYRLRPAARGADCRKRSGGEKVAAFVQAARADEIEHDQIVRGIDPDDAAGALVSRHRSL